MGTHNTTTTLTPVDMYITSIGRVPVVELTDNFHAETGKEIAEKFITGIRTFDPTLIHPNYLPGE